MKTETKKIVNFYKYCSSCKYKYLEEHNDPCNECLDEPYNIDSEKPVRWEENSEGSKNGHKNTK